MGFVFKSVLCVLVFAVLGMPPSAFAAPPPPGSLEKVSTNVGLGTAFDLTVAAGPDGKQNLYVSYLYFNSTLDLVAIDPNAIDTGANTVATSFFSNPTTTETGARTMILAPDGNLYLGTSPHAHILKFDLQFDKNLPVDRQFDKQRFKDLGAAPSPDCHDQSKGDAPVTIWKLALGADNKLYAATSPNSALLQFDYDSETPTFKNLGTMDVPDENPGLMDACADGQYLANTIAPGTGGDANYMYVGLGPETPRIVAFDTAIERKRPVSFEKLDLDVNDITGTASVWQAPGADGNIYGAIGGRLGKKLGVQGALVEQYFEIRGLIAYPRTKDLTPKAKDPTTAFSEGRRFKLDEGYLTITEKGDVDGPYKINPYKGNRSSIFRLGIGPGDAIYGSTALPARLMKFGGSDFSEIVEISRIGEGEAYSFATLGSKLYMGIYSGKSRLMEFTPTSASSENPVPLPYCSTEDQDKCLNENWRPFAMVADPVGNKLYTGGMAGYGMLGGPLTVYDPITKALTVYDNLISDQSIATLAMWRGQLIGGTSIYGDAADDKRHTQPNAVIFEFDPAKGKFTRTMDPFKGDPFKTAKTIDSLVVTSDKAFGIAFASDNQAYLFVVDLSTFSLATGPSLFLGNPGYNSMALGQDGHIWGLANTSPQRGGIFKINTKTHTASWVIRPRDSATGDPVYITAGFVLNGDQIYFSAGPDLWRYTIPYKVAPDILWRDLTNGDVSIWQMDPVTFAKRSSTVLKAANLNLKDWGDWKDWELSAAADFNGDGKNDILWRNTGAGTRKGQTSIWIMDGNRFVSEAFPGDASSTRKLKFTADFNGDGMPDILWRSGTGDVLIWLMDGVKLSSSGSPGTMSPDWDLIGPADFNGDNNADLLWRNTTTGQVAIWLLDGTKLRSTAYPRGAMLINKLVGTGDFNGDLGPDLVFRNTATGVVSIWLMNGVDFRYSTSPGRANLDWDLAAVTDFNGDGSSDLLWRNKNTGQLSAWRMSGTALAPSTDSGTLDYSTWQLSALANFDGR